MIDAFPPRLRTGYRLLCSARDGTNSVAFKFGEKTSNPLAMYLSDVFTIPTNLAGDPALSVPFGRGEGDLPIGVQLLGPGRSEADLFAAARVLEVEQAT